MWLGVLLLLLGLGVRGGLLGRGLRVSLRVGRAVGKGLSTQQWVDVDMHIRAGGHTMLMRLIRMSRGIGLRRWVIIDVCACVCVRMWRHQGGGTRVLLRWS